MDWRREASALFLWDKESDSSPRNQSGPPTSEFRQLLRHARVATRHIPLHHLETLLGEEQ